jgi:hypothetical protein
MKKWLWILAGIVILITFLLMGMGINNKMMHSTSPEEVLYHTDENKFSIQEIVHQEVFTKDKYAYVLFLTENKNTKDSLVFAEFTKTWMGWELDGMVLHSLKDELQSADGGGNRTMYGLTPSNVETVKLGKRKAQVYSLGGKKVWLIHKPSKKERKLEPAFYNKEEQKVS